jgi:hypothetical protein
MKEISGRKTNDCGATAVEFALVAPLLLILLLGIFEFGRAYNAQITLTQAAREGVRVMVLEDDATVAKSSTRQAAVLLDPALMTITISSRKPDGSGSVLPEKCALGHQVTVAISYPLDTLTGFFGPITLAGQGVMRCGG